MFVALYIIALTMDLTKLLYLYALVGRGKNGRFTREEKAKGPLTKPQRARNWAPTLPMPNCRTGILTRSKNKNVALYEDVAGFGENDVDYIANLGQPFNNTLLAENEEANVDKIFSNMPLSKSQHSVGSIETININLWDTVFRDDSWRLVEPIRKAPGYGASHPGGTLPKPIVVPVGDIPDHLRGVYSDWTSRRRDWAVLVPNRFLSDASFQVGYTPIWTQGHIIGEGTALETGKRMIVCNLGGDDTECHMEEGNVRVALGPLSRAIGSEGGHGYGWNVRQHSFSPERTVPPQEKVPNFLDITFLGCIGDEELVSQIERNEGDTEAVASTAGKAHMAPQPPGDPIEDYNVPSDVEGIDGTQDSTARTTFPKVSYTFPEYLLQCTHVDCDEQEEDALPRGLEDAESSDLEWLPEFCDNVESDDDDFDVAYLDESNHNVSGLVDWCMRPESFRPVYLDTEQLAQYYRKASWSSSSVDLVGSRDNFTGPPSGLKCPPIDSLPKPERVFNLYWSEKTLERIVLETNRYARTVLSNKPNEEPVTKGGKNWQDVDVLDIRGWLGICILMGCKRLPSHRQYWMRSESFLHCQLISEVMSRDRWEQILRCLHLVDNNTVVRDPKDPTFDRIAKTRWLVDMFVEVSEAIYNLEREITVDECVIPYKGRYCFIRQFMPDKPVRFGIKVWLLASSKSRFVWRIEVYFGEGSGSGEHGLGYHVVDRMIKGLEHRGHILVVDNLFASVNLFHHLMVQGIWATGTVRRRSKNLPAGLYRDGDSEVRGSMLIRTHVHRQMGVVSWQDKKLVTLLSTATAPWAPNTKVLRRVVGLQGQLVVPSSPMHQQYVEYMRGVDVTDQLRGNYSAQLRCHKWWLKIFHFVVDQSMVNSYVTYIHEMEHLGLKVMSHLQFKIAVGKHLIEEALENRQRKKVQPGCVERRPGRTHAPSHSKLKRNCVVCGHLQRWYCDACGKKWMCRDMCYFSHHKQRTCVL